MRRVLLTLVIAASCLLAFAPPAGISAAGIGDPCAGATSCYLAIGDSLTLGYQPNNDLTHGYAQDIYAELLTQPGNTGLKLADMACVGETSSTMLGLTRLGPNGSACQYQQYTTAGITTTPQITQAINIIQAHPGQIRLITLSIGANDLLALGIHATLGQVLATLQQFSTNLDQILTTLRAQAGPNVKIMIMNYFNPFIVVPGTSFISLGEQLVNNTIATQAQQHGVTVVDVYTAFNGAANPKGVICGLTWFCNLQYLANVHPNTQGYKVIAGVFLQAGAGNP